MVDPTPDDTTLNEWLGRFWTIPNVLSLVRMGLVLPITYLVVVDGRIDWLVGLIVLAAFSDWLDGRIARWSHTVSEWGKVIDPIADKFAAMMIVPALVFRPVEPTLPLWLLLVVVGRDLSIVAGGVLIAKRTGRIAVSSWAGKLAVAALSLTVLAAILKADPPILQFCVGLTAVLMGLSFVVYTTRLIRILRVTQHRPPPAPPQEDGQASDAVRPPAEREEQAKSVQ
ncbi:MAG: CDP-alcohol phosphatidyltransferase family protein [Bacteroidetes bacterium]|jgi:CDP-diacylglycerol--glycerol-3-phosphate 3-phosphatidyltransferase|nr:CDP-alcohol phosphatidyltransferase family protein [Bacteroidota bacterium]